MKNEAGKVIVSKSQYANLIRHFRTVEDFKNNSINNLGGAKYKKIRLNKGKIYWRY